MMEIKVDYIKTPVQKVKVSFKEAGRRGGLAKVPKGFAKMDEGKRKETGRKRKGAKRITPLWTVEDFPPLLPSLQWRL